MKMPNHEWRAWLYGIAWLLGGLSAFLLSIWLIYLIRWDWPTGTEAERLAILGNALYGALAIVGLVATGLTMRAAIRNLKGTAFGSSLEVNGKEGEK